MARATRAENGQQHEAGFTLLELLVVMIVIGVLAAIAIPSFLQQKQKAHETAAKSDATNVGRLLAYALADGGWRSAANTPVISGPGPGYQLTFQTTVDTVDVVTDVRVKAGSTLHVSGSMPAGFLVTVCPAPGNGSPWSATEAGLEKGGSCS